MSQSSGNSPPAPPAPPPEASIESHLSDQSFHALERIAKFGIYGRTSEEVAARMIDHCLQEWIVIPKLTPLVSR